MQAFRSYFILLLHGYYLRKRFPFWLDRKFHLFSGHRMYKGDPAGTQCHRTVSARSCFSTILCIPHQWVSCMGKLHPDLMMPSGMKPDMHQCLLLLFIHLLHLITQFCFLCLVCSLFYHL